MSETDVIDICRSAIITLCLVAGPIMAILMVIGTVISVFQAVTQINEQTLAMVPKIMIVFAMSMLLLPFMMEELRDFFQIEVADRIVAIGTNAALPVGVGGAGSGG